MFIESQMGRYTKGIIKTEKNMDKEELLGMTEVLTKEVGRITNLMDLKFLKIQMDRKYIKEIIKVDKNTDKDCLYLVMECSMKVDE